jgi:hypothetical protein
MIFKAVIVGLLIAAAEVFNGNLRVRYLQRRLGRKRGKRLSFLIGLGLIVLITVCLLPWVGPTSAVDCLQVGLVWTIILTALDLYFGRCVFRMSWKKILDDFNLLRGNFLGLGLLVLFFCPLLVFILT